MGRTLSVSEARAALPEVINRVLAGEEITLTRHGTAVAVVVRPDVLRARRADEALAAAERVRERLERARARPLADVPGLTREQADELLAYVRASRAAR